MKMIEDQVTRRDERYRLRPGAASVEFPPAHLGGGRSIARLTHACAAGLQCAIDAPDTGLEPETTIVGVAVRIGECRIAGDLVVKNRRRRDTDVTEAGCLFIPTAGADEDRWMAVLAGLDARDENGSDAA